ncbi:CorA family divalent cation transporter, partial [Chloroflexota bacterium]
MTDNALATYMSSVANKQNEVMKILSIVAAIFLPLGLITG